MKLKHTFFATLALMLAGSMVIYSRMRSATGTERQQTKTITFTCPQSIKVGPSNVEGEWKSSGNIVVQRGASIFIHTDGATKQQSVVCS